jgi:hypothetical protein
MVVMAVWTVWCTAGIAFYVLFLVALCREYKPRLTGYWVRLGRGSGEDAFAERQQHTSPATHAT